VGCFLETLRDDNARRVDSGTLSWPDLMMTLQRYVLTWGLVLAFGCSPRPSDPSGGPNPVAAVATVAPSSAAPGDSPPSASESGGDAAAPLAATDSERLDVERAPEPDRPGAGSDHPDAGNRKPDTKRIAKAIDEALRLASKCPSDKGLKGMTFPVTVTVSNDGALHVRVHDINISRPDDDFEELWAGPRGDCIPEQFAGVTVPPFDGEPVVVKRQFKMP